MTAEGLLPHGAEHVDCGELRIGGCAVSEVADRFGTPLYVLDEGTLRANARTYRAELAEFYPGSAQVAYASKAYLCTALAQLFAEEGLDLDVVSGGELSVALRAGFPADRIHFHGNNKSLEELSAALKAGIGRVVIDNFHEIGLLAQVVGSCPANQIPVWLRLAPGVQPHTHAHIQTGQEDTKFGFSIASGDAERALMAVAAVPGLALCGLHAHIGSQIYEPDALSAAAVRLIAFAAAMAERHGFRLRELSPGGGWGVPMIVDDPPAPIESYVQSVCRAIVSACQAHELALPHLVLEPGRSLVARAGVAVYRVGARKEIPGVRTYVSVDGGMADNIRPALYGARYTAIRVPSRAGEVPCGTPSPGAGAGANASTRGDRPRELVSIAGKFCESGDVLIRDIELPRLEPGDLLAIPMAGAYTLAMASNYNLAPRPAVVLVGGSGAFLIQERETYADLARRDLPLHRRTPDRDHLLRNAGVQPPAEARRFFKFHALGNDYIVLDPVEWPGVPGEAAVRRMCDRHRGVGADGVLWGPAGENPYRLRLFNPDGSEFEKSGNGLRVFARYLWDRYRTGSPAASDLQQASSFSILTPGGMVIAHVLDETGDRIAMEMGRLSFRSDEVGIAGPTRDVIEEEISVAGHTLRFTGVTLGNPHCVVFAEEGESPEGWEAYLSGLATSLGPALERMPLYASGTNVQFARVADAHAVDIAIWERGVGRTLASGTSSCAAAGAAIRTGRCLSPVTVRMAGGEMLVEVTADWDVRLTGAVEPVCSGVISPKLAL